MTSPNGQGNGGGQRMRLRDALEQGGNEFSVGAAAHAWRPLPSPCPLPLPTWERKGEHVAWGERRSPNPLRAVPGAARSVEGTCGGWRNKALAHQRSGCPDTVHSQ